MTLFNRPPGIAAMALVVIVGLAIGGWLAVLSRNQVQQARTVVRTDTAPAPLRTVPPPTRPPTVATSTAAPTVAPTVAATVAATIAATVAPTMVPTVAATVAAAPAVTADKALQGVWQIVEANVQVGMIVWF